MRRMEAPGQLVLLHVCFTCQGLVPYGRALEIAPGSPGANYPLHRACIEADRRWLRARLTGEWIHAKAAP